MVVKVYISSCSGNIEIKRKQEFVITVLNSKKIEYEEVDIADVSREEDKLYMREHAKPSGNDRVPLPPQIFVDDRYCGNYDNFHEANENDEIQEFLGLSKSSSHVSDQRAVDSSHHIVDEGDHHTTSYGGHDGDQSHNGGFKQDYDDDAHYDDKRYDDDDDNAVQQELDE